MIDAQDLEDKALQAWGVARGRDDLPAMLQVLHFLQELRLTRTPDPIEYKAPKHLGVAPGPQYSYEPSLEPSEIYILRSDANQGWNLPPDSPVLHTQLQERDAQVHAAPSPTREVACGSAQYYGHFPPFAEPV